MNEKLIHLIDSSVFKSLVMQRKKGIFTDELYRIGEKIWDEAQKDILLKLYEFEKENKILIITDEDREMIRDFNLKQKSHIEARKNFQDFLNERLEA